MSYGEHEYVYTCLDETYHKAVCAHCGTVLVESELHDFGEGDTCTRCGYTQEGTVEPTVSVECGVTYEPGYWFFWWNPGTYTAWADVDAHGAKVTKVEISQDGTHYRPGAYFTSRRNVTEFYVKVTTADGTTTWKYKNGKTTQVLTADPE